MGTIAIDLDGDLLRRLERLFEVGKIVGERYPPATQQQIDTEEFSKSYEPTDTPGGVSVQVVSPQLMSRCLTRFFRQRASTRWVPP
jgi:hypothetical protein